MNSSNSPMVVGVDFDNTIICYDRLIRDIAVSRGLIPNTISGKRDIRDALRVLPDGESIWQTIQAQIYGPGIAGAQLIEGVAKFFLLCQQRGIIVYIISHKTTYANLDITGTNLRRSALNWMEINGLFRESGGGLDKSRVIFATTRSEKIDFIIKCRCSHFIDDLIEVFQDPKFPTTVEKLFFDRSNTQTGLAHRSFSTWRAISAYLLDTA